MTSAEMHDIAADYATDRVFQWLKKYYGEEIAVRWVAGFLRPELPRLEPKP